MAECKTAEMLFQRGEDDVEDEDIWDDTALIKAYDEAVSLVKVKVAEQNGDVGENLYSPTTSRKQKRQKKKSKSNVKRRKWRIGDHCRAKFSEDGLVYEAEVLSVDELAGTCYVRYVDYGNEEEHELKDLMVTQGRSSRNKKPKESDPETDSGMDWRGNRTTSSIPSRPRSMTTEQTTSNHLPPSGFPGYPHFEPMMPPFAAPTFPAGFPPQPPPFSTSSRIPSMPPPPPPMFDMPDGDNEELCSMLMSWYMSGYHTGYYQGLQKGRKQSGANSPYVNR